MSGGEGTIALGGAVEEAEDAADTLAVSAAGRDRAEDEAGVDGGHPNLRVLLEE